MIRIIVRQQDASMAAHVQGACADVKFRSFDIEAPELEAWLKDPEAGTYVERSVVGVEADVELTR